MFNTVNKKPSFPTVYSVNEAFTYCIMVPNWEALKEKASMFQKFKKVGEIEFVTFDLFPLTKLIKTSPRIINKNKGK
jgi:hypothetical protein